MSKGRRTRDRSKKKVRAPLYHKVPCPTCGAELTMAGTKKPKCPYCNGLKDHGQHKPRRVRVAKQEAPVKEPVDNKARLLSQLGL